MGARKWDECSGPPSCPVPVNGLSELNPLTDGYMEAGDYPSFKIYDSSENIYYDAIPSNSIAWHSGDLINIFIDS